MVLPQGHVEGHGMPHKPTPYAPAPRTLSPWVPVSTARSVAQHLDPMCGGSGLLQTTKCEEIWHNEACRVGALCMLARNLSSLTFLPKPNASPCNQNEGQKWAAPTSECLTIEAIRGSVQPDL